MTPIPGGENAMRIVGERARRILEDEHILTLSPLAVMHPIAVADLAERRTQEITQEWHRLNGIRVGAVSLRVLVESAYLQGVEDAVEAAMRVAPGAPE